MLVTLSSGSSSSDDVNNSGNKIEYWSAEVNLTYTDPKSQKTVVRSYPGKYGKNSLVESKAGVMGHPITNEGKRHGCHDYHTKYQVPKETWVAVIQRGKCYFNEKILRATKKYNATAVMIYNTANEPVDLVMEHSGNRMTNISKSYK